ncbi:Gfo/Idh/MocA family oxidoreductase [Paenibacillus sp. GYB004]|uniref:Gfo/Idh/MocA family protein n=1 Tax=Paenibacillus sp. GYB004 TaxID=2994393 RepID=UPI002F96BF2B
MRLRVGLVGAGRRAQQSHLKVLHELRKDRLDFVAVCDLHEDTVRTITEQYQVAGYTNLRAMVAKERLDICIVTVPADAHHSVSCYLSSQGIHQLVETPIASHPLLAKQMIDAADQHQVKLEISENFPFMPVERMTMELIRAGVIGEIGRVYRLFSTTGYHGISVINERTGGTPIKINSLDHSFPVVPYKDRMQRTFEQEGLEFGVIRYDNEAMAIFMVGNKNSALGRNKLVGFEADGSRGAIITNGNQGAIGGEEVRVALEDRLQQGGETATVLYQREYADMEDVSVLQRMWVDLPDGRMVQWSNPFARYALPELLVSVAYMHDSLLQAVEVGKPLLYTAARAKTDMEILLAMRYSARRDGAPVSLPLQMEAQEEEELTRQFMKRYGKGPFDVEGLLEISFPRL